MAKIFDVNFGDRVAENEAGNLASYFVRTDNWEKVRSNTADIVFGSKGAGKSALYTLLVADSPKLELERRVLISAEKPKGQPVFSEISNEPPTTEQEFVTLWKIYLCQLIVQALYTKGLCDGDAGQVRQKLIDANLMEEENTLKRLVNSAMSFARRLTHIESIEGKGSLEGELGGKITFKTPDIEKRKLGYTSIDDLLEKLNGHLKSAQLDFWILFDRLDVAFDQDHDLERNALRALFKTYRDIEDQNHIVLKIFLRDDIWKRVTDDGFRESSHITRSTTIKWTQQSLLNLIIMRVLQNPDVVALYNVDLMKLRESYAEQLALYYKIFPEQVDIGEKQSDTFDWILNRVRDGQGNVAPRELIHFHNEIVIQEKEADNVGSRKVEGTNIFSRASIKAATAEVSRVKIEQNLFAEYPALKGSIQSLEGSKAEHNLQTLSEVWKLEDDATKKLAQELVGIGFFEQLSAKEEGVFKVPFIYRPYLRITQGKAFS